MTRRKQSLCTWWKYSVNGGPEEMKLVPFSALCVGDSECQLDFDAQEYDGCALLCFEGITYEADVSLNNMALGKMLPYCYYEFDVTDILREKNNTLSVKLRDIGVPFGPSGGWENYGGIIRDVYIKYVPKVYIKDFIWRSELSQDYSHAVCNLDVFVSGENAPYSIKAELISGNRIASQAVSEESNILSWHMDAPALWSPDTPNLYMLKISLIDGDSVIDTVSYKVGFKELKAEGSRFVLNGKPLFLCGVCRHDTWGHDQGHTLTEEQMKQDMYMIKSTGSNFVRLVHYPHHRKIIEIADEIGLLVSEEPGLWWSDLSNPEVTQAALDVIANTVKRDRNNVSVAFWLVFNECILTPEFLADAKAVCKRLDPTRMVSGANCMELKITKKMFSKAGFDFYCYHPYGSQINSVYPGYGSAGGTISLKSVLEYLDDKPVFFTEWGGWYVVDNPALFGQFMDFMISAWKSDKKGTILAGMTYWLWADIHEANRSSPDCKEGILIEGLVDVDRKPRINLEIFNRKLNSLRYIQQPRHHVEVFRVRKEEGDYIPLDISSACKTDKNVRAWQIAIDEATRLKGFFHKKVRRISYGPVLPEDCFYLGELPVELKKGLPVIISKFLGPVEITADIQASEIFFIGNVCLTGGYPTEGEKGELAARYVITCKDGKEHVVPLRNGVELSTAIGLHGPSRIDPRASAAPRVLKLAYDKNWEVYYINLFRVKLPERNIIHSIKAEVIADGYTLALYGITLKG